MDLHCAEQGRSLSPAKRGHYDVSLSPAKRGRTSKHSDILDYPKKPINYEEYLVKLKELQNRFGKENVILTGSFAIKLLCEKHNIVCDLVPGDFDFLIYGFLNTNIPVGMSKSSTVGNSDITFVCGNKKPLAPPQNIDNILMPTLLLDAYESNFSEKDNKYKIELLKQIIELPQTCHND